MHSPKDDIPPWVNDPDIPVDVPWHKQAGTSPTKGKKETTHTLHGYIHRQTEKAILFEILQVNDTPFVPDGTEGKKEWFPLSQTSTISQGEEPQDYDYIVVSDWIARVKGIL